MVEDPAVWTCMTNDSWTNGGLSTWQLSRVGLRWNSVQPRVHNLLPTPKSPPGAFRATLPATWMALFSSVSLLQVYQMGLFPGASCWFALVRNSTA